MPHPWPFQSIDRHFVAQVYDDYHEGLFILDGDGRIVYYNRLMAQMDGLASYEDVPGKHFVDIYNLTDKNSVSLGALVQQKAIKNRAVVYRTRLGTLVNAYCNSYPFFEDGRLAGVFCFTTDYNVAATALDELTRRGKIRKTGLGAEAETSLEAPYTFAHLVGRSPAFQEAAEKAATAARYDMAIMLVGETGSGKELFAQAIHNRKGGGRRRFMAVNCPAIPENLLESLLFGTTRGSFTGALDKPGLFEAADGGTIFLDEVNSMPLGLQSKLLRVLQEKRVSRVGSTREYKVNCQIISATGRNPYTDMAAGRLRQDLFYRLGAVVIHIPPLRDRPEDIALLCDHFIKKHKVNLKSRVRGVTPETLTWLAGKVWPGNVRELEHAVVSAMIFAKDDPYLSVEKFSTTDHFLEGGFRAAESPPTPAEGGPAPDFDWQPPVNRAEAKKKREAEEREALWAALARTGGHKAAAAAILGISPQLLQNRLKKYGAPSPSEPAAQNELRRIQGALQKCGGHKAAAALLGISRQLLYSKMKKYGL